MKEVTKQFDDLEPTKAARAIQDFVGDNLSNWYVRLNRKRFWAGEMTSDKLSAYQTLYQCLETVSLLIAPVAPFFADLLYRDLTLVTKGNKNSVHLANFPVCDDSVIDTRLEEQMRLAQTTTSMVLSLRRKSNIKVRQPLQTIMIPVADEVQKQEMEAMSQLVLNEVNVKEIKFVGNEEGVLVKRVKPDFKKLGPKFGKVMKALAAQIVAMSQHDIIEFEKAGEFAFEIDGAKAVVSTEDVEIISEDIPGWLVANEGSQTVALDITVTDELKKEGYARELVNRIQNLRKSSNFEITDKIRIKIASDEHTDAAISSYRDYIAKQVLADSIDVVPQLAGDGVVELDFDDFKLNVDIAKA